MFKNFLDLFCYCKHNSSSNCKDTIHVSIDNPKTEQNIHSKKKTITQIDFQEKQSSSLSKPNKELTQDKESEAEFNKLRKCKQNLPSQSSTKKMLEQIDYNNEMTRKQSHHSQTATQSLKENTSTKKKNSVNNNNNNNVKQSNNSINQTFGNGNAQTEQCYRNFDSYLEEIIHKNHNVKEVSESDDD